MSAGVRVEGLRELDRAFGKLAKDVRKELRLELRKAAEPVRSEAERRVIDGVRNIGGTWSQMRVGVTATGAYVAPKARRRGGSPRPNLGGELMEGMEDALADKTDEVVLMLDRMLDRLGGQAGF